MHMKKVYFFGGCCVFDEMLEKLFFVCKIFGQFNQILFNFKCSENHASQFCMRFIKQNLYFLHFLRQLSYSSCCISNIIFLQNQYYILIANKQQSYLINVLLTTIKLLYYEEYFFHVTFLVKIQIIKLSSNMLIVTISANNILHKNSVQFLYTYRGKFVFQIYLFTKQISFSLFSRFISKFILLIHLEVLQKIQKLDKIRKVIKICINKFVFIFVKFYLTENVIHCFVKYCCTAVIFSQILMTSNKNNFSFVF
eukprot:TRINITY_DN8121_c0_g1_i2.p2 TRINITY_DN8121_c0_g1~~TRINITY_DN8121_c0_g1_i2.p2  ORF type:complete len:253 (-),score=-12.31 TRINITY_DN8121_c0_g1_i2:840-1598(-)